MVAGDGVNDVLALKAAQCSIAMALVVQQLAGHILCLDITLMFAFC